MNTQKKLIALLLHTIISFAIIMLIVGCPMDSDNSDNSDTTAPTIVSSVTGKTKVVVTFSEAITFGSEGNANGTGFTVTAGTENSLLTETNVTATISDSILTLTFGTALTNTQTHVQVEFEDNAIADTAENVLATNTNTGVLTVDSIVPTILTTLINPANGRTTITMAFSEQIVFGTAVGTPLHVSGIIGILEPEGFTIATGANDTLGTSQQVNTATISFTVVPFDSGDIQIHALDLTFEGELPTGYFAQVTFREDTIFDLAGNALAKNTVSGKAEVAPPAP